MLPLKLSADHSGNPTQKALLHLLRLLQGATAKSSTALPAAEFGCCGNGGGIAIFSRWGEKVRERERFVVVSSPSSPLGCKAKANGSDGLLRPK